MKIILRIFLYGSILALLYYLIRIDYVAFEKLQINYLFVAVSMIFLFLGFVFSAISWKVILKLHNVHISVKQSIVSHGLPTFTKYIPGRVWTILGRAALIQDKDKSVKFLSFISFKEQLIYLCLGFLISIYPMLKTPEIRSYSSLIILLSLAMFLVLFSKSLHKLFEVIWNKVFKKKISIPLIEKKEFIIISWYILFYWILWSAGFYFLLYSVFGNVPLHYAFAFPLSVSLGLISIIFPGGIGVREGVITLFLVSNGIQPEIAVSFSILSRLWFVAGEILIFITALALRKKS